jgi:hypothetical protein
MLLQYILAETICALAAALSFIYAFSPGMTRAPFLFFVVGCAMVIIGAVDLIRYFKNFAAIKRTLRRYEPPPPEETTKASGDRVVKYDPVSGRLIE